jgi:DNA-binding GntR family transcriptional regulator
MAIKLCILHGSNSEIMRMREIAEQCFVAGKAGDTALRIKKDCEFHLQIALITKNIQLIKFAKELMIRIEFIQASRYIAMIDPQEQLKEHNKIIDLLVDRKKDEVIKLIIKHGTSFHGISTEYPTDFFN